MIKVESWSRIIDPSAGTGDLLLEISRQLPLEATVSQTLKAWSKRLGAIELRSSFISVAWSRLHALARLRHAARGDRTPTSADRPMPMSFQVGNALKIHLDLRSNDCVIMNPPYQRMNAPSGSFVGTGMRSAAGLHLERVVNQAPPDVGIVALVPDVLRSGSSYRRFRDGLSKRIDIKSFEAAGKFGGGANVDVAIIFGTTRASSGTKSAAKNSADSSKNAWVRVGDAFHVSVGPVVPHRTAEGSARKNYLTGRNATVWSEIRSAPATATFDARLEQAPFVVVRRTSSPSDRQRARASFVVGTDKWLVENHLLVVRPLSGTLADCRRILDCFADPRTSDWLNKHIRCRHLTVDAIKTMPWWNHCD